MALHEPKDPLVLPHRIFLGRKFDLQVNGILKKYETKLPLSLNYSEVFLEEIILVQNILVQKCWSKGLNNLGQTRPILLYPTALSLGSQLRVELVKNKRIKISKQWVPPNNLRIFRCYSEHWTIFMGTNFEELEQVFEIFSNLLNSKSLLPLEHQN